MAALLGGQKKRFISQIWILKGRIERPFLRLEINQIAKDQGEDNKKKIKQKKIFKEI